jgi:hypothetical protein
MVISDCDIHLATLMGKIMNMGVYFSFFMRKNPIFSHVLQFLAYKSIFVYLEFHFTVKTKLVNNFVSFPMTIFQFFLLRFDISI